MEYPPTSGDISLEFELNYSNRFHLIVIYKRVKIYRGDVKEEDLIIMDRVDISRKLVQKSCDY